MDVQSLPRENTSYSRLITRGWHDIFNNRLQWFRWTLGLAAGFHLAPNLGKLYWHYNTHHTASVFPDFLALSLSVAARFSWVFLFRDPSTFLQFKRPGRAYRWMVCGTVALTTLPNTLVHIWALRMALRNDTIILSGIVAAVIAIIFLIPLIGLVWWMAWRFLLGLDESDEDFEPTVKNNVAAFEDERQPSPPNVEPHTNNVTMPWTRPVVATQYLAQAYKLQNVGGRESSPDQSSTGCIGIPQPDNMQNEVIDDAEQPSHELPNATPITGGLRCKTIARFEYIPQNHYGPHSWLSYPLIPLILSIYATILLVGLPIWIHEDRQYKLRAPSTTIKKSFFVPLGLYLLSFYALKHRLRASLFERFHVPPPEPWRRMLSILPYWVGTGGTFKNVDTGEITVYDPRRRAFPWRAYRQPALVHTRAYLAAYNASTAACPMFWGHSGRIVKTELRFRPTIHRIGFLFFAMYLTWQGFWNTVFYKVPNVYEEILKHPKEIEEKDVMRILRIVKMWQALVFSDLGFTVLALTFGTACMVSMSVHFCKAVWRYVPQEEKDRIMREAREREQVRSEGRIRLE